MSNYAEPDRQCIICRNWKNIRKFVAGTYVCRSCSIKLDRKGKKERRGK